MNQKDYKEIAKIIKTSLEIPLREMLANRLADHFEREWKKIKKDQFEGTDLKADIRYFNREQFLKDCGVKK